MSRITSIARRIGVAGVAAALASTVLASTASADQFSPFVPPNKGTIGDCGIAVGPVLDPYQQGAAFAAIGGFQINCAYRHTISASVWEAYSSNGVNYYWQPTGRTFTAQNTTGYGNGILETGRSCGNGYWYTRATVTVSGVGTRTFDSTAKPVNARLC